MVESLTIQNITTGKNLVMDKLTTDDFILDYIDWNQASVDQFTSKFIGQFGVSIVGISFKQRDIEISGFIIADTEEEMAERKIFLNAFINPQCEYNAIYKRYKIAFKPNVSVRYTNTEETNNNEVICRFKISAICPYPLFSLISENSIYVGEFLSAFHFPFHSTEDEPIIFGVRSDGPYRKRTIRNDGHVATGIRFTMKAEKGEVLNPTLYNFTTNQKMQIAKRLVLGEKIEVNTEIGQKNIIGIVNGTEYNYLKYMSDDSSWIFMTIGGNIIGYGADEGLDNLDIRMEVPEKFLEVQECY